MTPTLNEYLQQIRKLAAGGEHLPAIRMCHEGLAQLHADAEACLQLYYSLSTLTAAQPGHAADCMEVIEAAEQHCPDAQRRSLYYRMLAEACFAMLARDAIAAADQRCCALLLRLLREPLDYSREALGISLLVLRILNAPELRQRASALLLELLSALDATIRVHRLSCPLAVLTSTASSDEQRRNAYQELLRTPSHHAVQLCSFHPHNRSMLQAACAALVASGEELHIQNGEQIYDLLRTVYFTDQQLAEQLLDKLCPSLAASQPAESEPLGLLRGRWLRRRALLSGLAGTAPRSGSRPRLRIALCIGGQLRGCEGTLDNLRRVLGLNGHEVSIFVHSWFNIGRKFPILVHAHRSFSGEFCAAYYRVFARQEDLPAYLERYYPCFYALLTQSNTASPQEVTQWFQTPNIVLEDEADQRFTEAGRPWDNPRKMYYKIHAAQLLACSSGQTFDLIIRARPDLRLSGSLDSGPDLHEICAQSRSGGAIFAPGGLISNHIASEYMIDDNLALGVPEVMQIYADTYLALPEYRRQHTWGSDGCYAPHITLEHHLFCSGIHTRELALTATFADPERLGPQQLLGALSADCASRKPRSEDRILLRACKTDIRHLAHHAPHAGRKMQ